MHKRLSRNPVERIKPLGKCAFHRRAARARGEGVPRHATVLDVPWLLTPHEAASLLRTSRKGIYAMIERRLLPGVTRVGRRVLIRRDDLVDWLGHKSAPSLKE